MKEKVGHSLFNASSFTFYPTSFFLQRIFEKNSRAAVPSDPLHRLIRDEFVSICRDFDFTQIQDSWSWRNTHMARELALLLIDEKGEINKKVLFKAIQLL